MKYIILSILTLSFLSCLDGELYGYKPEIEKENSANFIPYIPSDSAKDDENEPNDTINTNDSLNLINNNSNYFLNRN